MTYWWMTISKGDAVDHPGYYLDYCLYCAALIQWEIMVVYAGLF